MGHDKTTWNGYTIIGDAGELDYIVQTTGYVNLDKNDVITTLTADGENYVTTGVADNIDDAFRTALSNIPVPTDKIDKLLIQLLCGSRQPIVSEIRQFYASLSAAPSQMEIIWGFAQENALEESFKVILLASTETKQEAHAFVMPDRTTLNH